MVRLTGKVIDEENGEALACRVQVLESTGQFVHPPGAILKVGPGAPFFYCDGSFQVDVTRGITQVVVERGTEIAQRGPGLRALERVLA